MGTSCHITLPQGFRTDDMVAYHLRDPLRLSEKYENGVLIKGLVWDGQPARLALKFKGDSLAARLDAGDTAGTSQRLEALLYRMLGLNQDIAAFEQAFQDHPQLGPVLQRQRGLRVPVAATPYEALLWAVIGQQISVQAAVAIRRRFIQAAACRHTGDLWCHPDATATVTLSSDTLRAAGLSATKAATIQAISRAVIEGTLPLDEWTAGTPAAPIREHLLRLKGIGPWTADYTLLRGYGWLDGSLHGDAAVRRSLRQLTASDQALNQNYTRDWLAGFAPWRALAAAHLWASKSLQA